MVLHNIAKGRNYILGKEGQQSLLFQGQPALSEVIGIQEFSDIGRWYYHMGFPGGVSGKEPTCQSRRLKRHWFDPWVGKTPWRRARQPIPLFLPGESYEQGRLAHAHTFL